MNRADMTLVFAAVVFRPVLLVFHAWRQFTTVLLRMAFAPCRRIPAGRRLLRRLTMGEEDEDALLAQDPPDAVFDPVQALATMTYLFGKKVLRRDGDGWTHFATAEAVEGKAAVLMLFTAHGCPACTAFTSVLAEAYDSYREKSADVEIVFVSSDRERSSFEESYKNMPWLALPFEDGGRNTFLSAFFGIQRKAIPRLVLLNKAGDMKKRDCVADVKKTKDLQACLRKWGF